MSSILPDSSDRSAGSWPPETNVKFAMWGANAVVLRRTAVGSIFVDFKAS